MNEFPIELLDTAQMSEADRLTIEGGIPGIDLMERAGAAVADAARQSLAKSGGTRVAILCGPGNNGGDGFVAACFLKRMGYSVSVGLLGQREQLRGDAALAAQAWTGRIGSAALIDLDNSDLVIDALFGAGLTRDIEGRARAIVERVNAWRAASGKIVVAVDVPSGLDGNSGIVRGAAIDADITVTFFRLKPGHLLLQGRLRCGRIVLEQIGIREDVLASLAPGTFVNCPALWKAALPVPRAGDHKYSRGHAAVVSGPAHQTGAARLAAEGALRGGAGLVTVLSPREAMAANAAHLTSIMLMACDDEAELASILGDRRKNALAIGPGAGAGAHTKAMVETALRATHSPALVLDADALTSFSGEAAMLATLVRNRRGPVVLTPHDGEFSRLFPAAFDDCDGKLDRTRKAAAETGAIVMLKGADTVVAAPDGRAAIARNAPAWLATAGSGDVLAGIIAGLLAQGMPAFEAAAAAVWMHGDAAAEFGPGLVSSDLPAALPAVWRKLTG